MKIRRMSDADKSAWIELRRALWPDCPPARHALEVGQLPGSSGVVLLAEDSEERVVGFAEVSIRRDHVEGAASAPVTFLEGWYVVSSHRRQGIGRALIESAAKWASDAGFSVWTSGVER